MGTFRIDIEVGKPTARPTFVRANSLLVNMGSEVTWIAARTLQSLRIDIRKKDQAFLMANGQQISRDVGYAILRCNGFETVDEVVFAQPGDLQLLGARTLEGFNAVVDARRKRLVAAGPMPAARSSLC